MPRVGTGSRTILNGLEDLRDVGSGVGCEFWAVVFGGLEGGRWRGEEGEVGAFGCERVSKRSTEFAEDVQLAWWRSLSCEESSNMLRLVYPLVQRHHCPSTRVASFPPPRASRLTGCSNIETRDSPVPASLKTIQQLTSSHHLIFNPPLSSSHSLKRLRISLVFNSGSKSLRRRILV